MDHSTPIDPTSSAPAASRLALYIHRWQPVHAAARMPTQPFAAPVEGFVTPSSMYTEQVDSAALWRAAGYDVVVFPWIPYADEPTPFEVEQKIWDGGKQHR